MWWYVLAVVIIVFILIVYNMRSTEEILMKGFWTADTEFCKMSELTMMTFYIGDDGYCYVIAANNDGLILNNAGVMQMSKGIVLNPTMCNSVEYSVNVKWNDEPGDAFPSKFTLTHYPKKGKVLINVKDKIYASLWKDNEMTN